jgi:cell division protein FtsQ
VIEQTPAELPPDIRWMRRSTGVLVLLAVLLALGLLGLVLARSPWFDWRQLRIEGDTVRNSEAQLRANALPRVAGNFLTTSLPAVRTAFEAVPWVRRAEVRRVWPAQLVVHLEEHRAVALWDGRGDFGEPPPERALLNAHGEVFHAYLGEVEDERLPQLAGPTGSEAQVLGMWQRLHGIASRQQLMPLRLELSGRGSWRLLLAGGVSVDLGRGEAAQLAARFERFLPHAQAVAQRFNTQIRSADLRHEGGYALRLAGITTQAPQTDKKPRKP